MRRAFIVIGLTSAIALATAAPAYAERLDGSEHGGLRLTAELTGTEEVPGPGDPDGSGFAVVTLNPGQEEVCWHISVANIDPATAAHIHFAPAGVAGPVVVTLSPPNAGGTSSGCDTVDRALIQDIKKHPADYYVNVHNAPFPPGAVRGQLTR